MHFTTIVAPFTVIAAALASPQFGGSDICPDGLYNTPRCCATDVLGVASLNCQQPKFPPPNKQQFEVICGSNRPQCCTIPVAGQALLCQDV